MPTVTSSRRNCSGARSGHLCKFPEASRKGAKAQSSRLCAFATLREILPCQFSAHFLLTWRRKRATILPIRRRTLRIVFDQYGAEPRRARRVGPTILKVLPAIAVTRYPNPSRALAV